LGVVVFVFVIMAAVLGGGASPMTMIDADEATRNDDVMCGFSIFYFLFSIFTSILGAKIKKGGRGDGGLIE
jgi:hypothetical protein